MDGIYPAGPATSSDGKGFTIEELEDIVKSLKSPPKITDFKFVSNPMIPDDTIMVSPKTIELLKEIFKLQPCQEKNNQATNG